MMYSSLEYSERNLALPLQFGTYKAEGEHFRLEKRETLFERVVLKISRPFIFWLPC